MVPLSTKFDPNLTVIGCRVLIAFLISDLLPFIQLDFHFRSISVDFTKTWAGAPNIEIVITNALLYVKTKKANEYQLNERPSQSSRFPTAVAVHVADDHK